MSRVGARTVVPLAVALLAVTAAPASIRAGAPSASPSAPARPVPASGALVQPAIGPAPVTALPGSVIPSTPPFRLSAYGLVSNAGTVLTAMTPDGAHAYMQTQSSTLTDLHGGEGRVIASGGGHPTVRAVSGDGRAVAFTTSAALVPEDQDAYPNLYLELDGVLHLVADGAAASLVAMAADGSAMVLESEAPLAGDDDPFPYNDLFRWEVATDALTLLTPGTGEDVRFVTATDDLARVLFATGEDLSGTVGSTRTGIYERVGDGYVARANGPFKGASADMGRVYFASAVAHVAEDTDDTWDGYAWDSVRDTYTLLTPGVDVGDIGTGPGQVAADGSRWLVYTSDPLVPADTDTAQDTYLFSATAPPLLIAAVDGGAVYGNEDLSVLVLAPAAGLVPADADGTVDFYRATLETLDAPVLLTGPAAGDTYYGIRLLGMSPDGDRIAYLTTEALDAGDADDRGDVYVWTAQGRVLVTPGTTDAIGDVKVSGDVERLAFRTRTQLLPEDVNVYHDWYLADFDLTPPAPVVSGPPAWTNATSADVGIAAAAGDAVRFACAIDGGAPAPCGPTLHLDGLGDGPHGVAVTAWDAVGNVSAPVVRAWSVDTIPPSVDVPRVAIPERGRMGTSTVTVTVTVPGWSDSGSGYAGFRLEQRTDGGAWQSVSGVLPGLSTSRSLAPGHTYELGVRAVDLAGNLSERRAAAPLRPLLYAETSSGIAYSGTWRSASASSYMGGRVKYATSRYARATFTFYGRSVTWVTTYGARGRAEVWVDGRFRATIPTTSTTTRTRVAAYTATWPTAGTHRIQIRVLGTPSTKPRIDIDAFIVLR